MITSTDAWWYPILIEGLGAIGILAAIIAFQCKKHRGVMFWRTMNETFFGIQFLLLGAYTGLAMNFVGCIRNILFAINVEKGKSNRPWIVAFCLLFTAFGIATWQGPKSILVISAKIISTNAYGNKNLLLVRSCILVTATSWLIYDLLVGSVSGAICEAFTLTSLVVGIVRCDLLPRFKKKGDA